jgi:Gpi18-like mannosyltransferase
MAGSGGSPAAAKRLLRLLALAAAGGLAVLLHLLAWPTATPDMHTFLLPWYAHIQEHGPIGAFAVPFSNYTPAYLYLLAIASTLHPWVEPMTVIKLVSVFGTLCLAASAGALLKAAGSPHYRTGGALLFLLPTPLLNAAFIGQCDAFWTAACVMAVAAAIRRQPPAMLVWCGIALAFKAQAAFLAPFVFAVLLRERTPVRLWLIPPAIYAAIMTPAWLAGWPALDLMLVYARQTVEFASPGNLANPWVSARHLMPIEAPSFYVVGYSAAAAAAVAFVVLLKDRLVGSRLIIGGAILSALMLPWLLPKMHERYFLLADVLAFVLALAVRDRSTLLIAVLVQFASLSAIFSYTFNRPLPVMLGGLIAGGALLAIIDWMRREMTPAAQRANS